MSLTKGLTHMYPCILLFDNRLWREQSCSSAPCILPPRPGPPPRGWESSVLSRSAQYPPCCSPQRRSRSKRRATGVQKRPRRSLDQPITTSWLFDSSDIPSGLGWNDWTPEIWWNLDSNMSITLGIHSGTSFLRLCARGSSKHETCVCVMTYYVYKYLWIAYGFFKHISGWATPGIMIKRPVWLVLPLWWLTVMPMSKMHKALMRPEAKHKMFWISWKVK